MKPTLLTLGQSAKATGKSKPTLSKAIKAGRLTGHKKANGEYEIEPSELFRVYPKYEEKKPETPVNPEYEIKLVKLESKLETANARLEERNSIIAELKEECQRWDKHATSLLEDKRSAEERAAEREEQQRKQAELAKAREEDQRKAHESELSTMRGKLLQELEQSTNELNEHREMVQMLQASRIGRWLLNRQKKHKGIDRLPKQPSKAKAKKQAAK